MDSPSPLFPDITPDDYAQAERHAALLSVDNFTCTADDVLLAMHMVNIGEDLLAKGFKSKALRRLCDDTSAVNMRAMISLAKSLQEIRDRKQPEITHDAINFINTLAAVLHFIAPDRAKAKHPKG